MGSGRRLASGQQLELPPTRRAGFTIVVYRKVPTGAARLAETVRQASERFLREEWAANLATFEKRLIGSLD